MSKRVIPMKAQRGVLVRISIVAVAMTFFFATLTPGMTASEPQSKLEGNRVTEQASDLSQTYDAISALPIDSRRAVFRALSAEWKSELWRMHMTLYLSQHPELTGDQKSVILDAIALATPQLFEVSEDSPEWQTAARSLELLRERALEVFPHAVATEIFAQLGAPEEPDLTPASRDHVNAVGSFPTCSCSIVSDWCACPMQCVGGGCLWKKSGCGTFWQYACTGLCKIVDPCGSW